MILEELITPEPAHTDRLQRGQDRVRDERNANGLRLWYVTTFGPVAGPLLYAGAGNVPPTPAEIARFNR